MAINFRPLVFGAAAFLLNCSDPQPPPTTSPPSRGVPVVPVTPVAAAIDLGVTPMSIDEVGVPRLLRGGAKTAMMPASDATASARMHVEQLAPAWGVAKEAIPALEAVGEQVMPSGTIVRLRQVIEGIPVDRDSGGEVTVMVGG